MSLFQLTSSRRGWRDHSWQSHDESYFNSHPHEEDDIIQNFPAPSGNISTHILTKRMTHSTCVLLMQQRAFQLTSSRRGWPLLLPDWQHMWYFNSHPHEEDDSSRFRISTLSEYFNSHPHEEDDWNPTISDKKQRISTHILTKRMTDANGNTVVALTFQLTSSRRGWPGTDIQRYRIQNISTHILTKRMTEYGIL